MKSRLYHKARLLWIAAFIVVFGAFVSCQTENEVQRTLTLQVKEDLSQYDSVTVEIKSLGGNLLARIPLQKFTNQNQLKSLPVPGYDGGQINIDIIGYNQHKIVFTKQFQYDGAKSEIVSSTIVIPFVPVKPIDTTKKTDTLPRIDTLPKVDSTPKIDTLPKIDTTRRLTSLQLNPHTLNLRVGDTTTVLVASKPDGLDPKVIWRLEPSGVITIAGKGLVSAVKNGTVNAIAISSIDSTKRDSIQIQVLKDIPILNVGKDTVIAKGMTATFSPTVTKILGEVVMFQWDLNGDSVWDGSATSVRPVVKTYTTVDDIVIRFRIVDADGNSRIYLQGLRVIDGLSVNITSPANNAKVNTPKLRVRWSVNNVEQKVDTLETLKNGWNVVIRSATDDLQREFFDTIHVILDTTPPNPPTVKLIATSGIVDFNTKPVWTWTPASPNEAGIYRLSLDSLSNIYIDTLKATAQQAQPGIREGLHTLFVQEKDSVGNWSLPGSVVFLIDGTPPGKPTVTSQITDFIPVFTLVSGGEGSGRFQIAFDDTTFFNYFETKTTKISLLEEGMPLFNAGLNNHVLYARELDSVGNASAKTAHAFTLTLAIDYSLPTLGISMNSSTEMHFALGSGNQPYVHYALSTAQIYRYNATLKSWETAIDSSMIEHYYSNLADDRAGNVFYVFRDTSSIQIRKRASTGWIKWGGDLPLPLGTGGNPTLAVPPQGNPLVFTGLSSVDSLYEFPSDTIPTLLAPLSNFAVSATTSKLIWDSVGGRLISAASNYSTHYLAGLIPPSSSWTQLGALSRIAPTSSIPFISTNAQGEILRAYSSDNNKPVVEKLLPSTGTWQAIGESPYRNSIGTHPLSVVSHRNGSYYLALTDPKFALGPSLLKYDPSETSPKWKHMYGLTLSADTNCQIVDMRIGQDNQIYLVMKANLGGSSSKLRVLKLPP